MPYTEPARDLGRRQLAYAFKQSRDVSSIVGVLGELECDNQLRQLDELPQSSDSHPPHPERFAWAGLELALLR